MKRQRLTEMGLNDLVELFIDLSTKQGEALVVDDTRSYNALFRQLTEIDHELRARGKNSRFELSKLFDHPNPFVRLNAASDLLGLLPQEARSVLEKIRDARIQPEALDAGMMLCRFDRGEWVPD